jgi:MFS family permease
MGPYLGAGLALMLGGRLLLLFDQEIRLFGGSIVLAPWQLIFIAVSLPGLFLILLLSFLKEPKRKEKVQEHDHKHSLSDALRFVWSRFRVYFAFWGGASFLVVMLYGLQAWVPTYLVRVHSWTLSEAGLTYGFIALVGGSGGVLSGPVLSRRLEKSGRRDAPLIVAAFAGVMLTILGIVTFMLSAETAALIGIFLLSFFVTLPLTLMATSLQKITPNEYRGFVAGVYVVSVNIFGLGLGPTFVAFLTDMVFKSEVALNFSLATLFALFAPVSAVIYSVGRSPFVKLLDDGFK